MTFYRDSSPLDFQASVTATLRTEAIKFVLRGASIMCPGLTSPGGAMEELCCAMTAMTVMTCHDMSSDPIFSAAKKRGSSVANRIWLIHVDHPGL